MIIYRHKLLDCKINNYKIYMIYYTHLYDMYTHIQSGMMNCKM